jgi:hypothetical protein
MTPESRMYELVDWIHLARDAISCLIVVVMAPSSSMINH